MPPDKPDDDQGRGGNAGARKEIYIEYKQVGQAIKVTAIDAETGLEAVIMGPASAAQTHLQKIAVQKLEMQLKKNSEQTEEDTPRPDSKKGWTA